MSAETEKQIFNYLLSLGCCKCCSLRYLGNRSVDFTQIDTYIEKKQYLLVNPSISDDNVHLKKWKHNPCIVCLGLLQNDSLNDILNRPELLSAKSYDSKVFTCSISVPACTLLREHAVRVKLERIFPKFYIDGTEEIALNKTWKFMIKDKLALKLNKTFENSDICDFSINIVTEYEFDLKELSVLSQIVKPKVGQRKINEVIYGRKSIINILADVSNEVFEEAMTIYFEVPSRSLTCKSIECKHNSIYMAGRYCKFSRELSQSPWIVEGVKTMETSVQEIIFQNMQQILSMPENSLKFAASGREDCDVRCLRKGRPFYIEILDPKKTLFTFQEFRNVEHEINKSTLINVRDLQMVPRREVDKIKIGEESKTKDYIALCRSKICITQEHMDKINAYGCLDISQKTPIRVLHRRPLTVRKKTIHNMKATLLTVDEDHIFELYLVTQAGTYVKEFVHGDFGRTSPCVGNLIGAETDIIALDVVSINLDWPKEVCSQLEHT